MAKTSTKPIQSWKNFHMTDTWPAKMLLETQLEKRQIMPDPLERYRDAAQEIRRLLQEALDTGEGFRALGSKWSLSNIAHHEERMHINQKMNLKIPIAAQDLHPDAMYDPKNLFLFQCGNVIKEISEYLFDLGKSLKTSGASNGQTIAGAVSTGVHGSAVDFGAVQDFVVGLNLIIGHNPEDIVYLERSSQPTLNDEFAAQLNARIIRNDDLFNAALIGLGSFGFIHGVVIEVEDCFLLQRYVKSIDKNLVLQMADSMDFAPLGAIVPEEVEQIRPFHYKVYINPYHDNGKYIVEFWYKKPFHRDYPDPIPQISEAIYLEIMTCFNKLIRRHSKSLIPKMIKLLQASAFPEPNESLIGPLKDLCWDEINQGRAFSCSVGIPHEDTSRALTALVEMSNREGPVPGIFILRFVKASAATLAFTKFPITCILEIDGTGWDGSRKLISQQKYYERFIETLQAHNIPFTIHWGKNAAWGFPGLLEQMYGDQAPTKWKTYRSALLGPEMTQVFSNGFLRTIGLDDYVGGFPPDLLV